HDVIAEDDGMSYLQRFGKGTQGAGWHSFDQDGVHFIGLVNVVNLKAGGWATDDSVRALSYLKRFGSVSVLNGHIHQVMQKVEGNVTFHTAMSTAFPQPAPGAAPSPGPMKVPDEKLRSLLGITEVTFKRGQQRLAVIDTPLKG